MTYEARGRQDGMTVFQISGDDEAFVMNEVKRYGLQYATEGPLVIEQKFGRRWKKLVSIEKLP